MSDPDPLLGRIKHNLAQHIAAKLVGLRQHQANAAEQALADPTRRRLRIDREQRIVHLEIDGTPWLSLRGRDLGTRPRPIAQTEN